MAERTGIDGKPYHIGFELRLPLQWNGRLLYQGGGGNDGVIRPAVGPQAAPGYALNRGFAVVTTDAGHQGPTADFGFDPIARTDNAYNAHDKVAVTAKELLRAPLRQAGRARVLHRLLGRRAPGHDVHAALPVVLRRRHRHRAGDARVEGRHHRRGLGHAGAAGDRARRAPTASRC